ncbi:MAG: hypothetical protein IPM56_02360 [Ignavibacteriales bacterium]|nr:MAG: hypothetical protein IPM56_02360 [Ignavibacteriales bacterium]
MSLNKNYFVVIILSALLFSCGEEKKEEIKPVSDLTSPEALMKEAKNLYGKNVQNMIKGFYTDSSNQFAVMTETITPDVWGINFNLMVQSGSGFESKYKSDLLPGSFKESETKIIKLPGFDYDLLYYNSLFYFMGSGGGEIFSYVVDFSKQKIYYAHLIADLQKPVSLFLSPDTDVPEIKDFFIKTFRNDYPNLALIDEDIELE